MSPSARRLLEKYVLTSLMRNATIYKSMKIDGLKHKAKSHGVWIRGFSLCWLSPILLSVQPFADKVAYNISYKACYDRKDKGLKHKPLLSYNEGEEQHTYINNSIYICQLCLFIPIRRLNNNNNTFSIDV